MPVLSFADSIQHAQKNGYKLPLVRVSSLPQARGVMAAAREEDAPLALAIGGEELEGGLFPSLEALARESRAALSLAALGVKTEEQAVQAVRLGVSALIPETGIESAELEKVREIGGSCGVPVLLETEIRDHVLELDGELEKASLRVLTKNPDSWRELDGLLRNAGESCAREAVEKAGAKGRGGPAAKDSRSWNPVEHLIIYNTTADEAASKELAREGRRVLDRIPGVRATWSGRSVKEDAAYRWCWLIRFAQPAVIESYRDHPEHVAYADNHFRPQAGDRISIDYQLTGADET